MVDTENMTWHGFVVVSHCNLKEAPGHSNLSWTMCLSERLYSKIRYFQRIFSPSFKDKVFFVHYRALFFFGRFDIFNLVALEPRTKTIRAFTTAACAMNE